MANSKRVLEKKKYFTAAEANAALPLVRAIVRDITELAHDLRERQERFERLAPRKGNSVSEAYQEEQHVAKAEIERDQERLIGYTRELKELGVELKDYFTGLVDFPCRMDNREVYLCWRLGEAEVAYWHELEAGFAGRQCLKAHAAKT
jgi:hypothetical protein